jgi:sporulation protein YlmC with PRC-barrel domain
MRLASLIGAEVRDAAGSRLGVVHEVYARDGKVQALGIGIVTFIERLRARRRGRRIPWSKVRKIEKGAIIVDE